MKSLISLITEATEDLKLPINELVNDYDTADSFPTGQEKKDLIAKYHVETKKIDDIKKAILIQLRNERSTRKEFTKEDIRYFFNLTNLGERYQSCEPWFKEETKEFLVFFKDYCWKELERQKLTQKVRWAKSEWKYGTSYANQTAMNRFLNVEKFLQDNEPSAVKAKAEKENFEAAIEAKLIEQTGDFHNIYIQRAKESAERIYDNAPKTIENAKKKIAKAKEAFEAVKKSLADKGVSSWRMQSYFEYKDAEKAVNRYENEKRKAEAILKFTKKDYIAQTEKYAEEVFASNIKTLAQKLNDKELSVTDIKIETVADDPKYFEIMLTDGTKKIYARSIWAAQYSDKMIPHLRFIITERK